MMAVLMRKNVFEIVISFGDIGIDENGGTDIGYYPIV